MEEKIAEMNAQIVELREEIRRERLRKDSYDNGFEMGAQLVATKQGLIDAGLTDAEAMDIIKLGLAGGMK